MSNQATRLAELISQADKCIAWHQAGCPVEDPHDTFPDDLWGAMTSPERLKPFLAALLALVQPAVSEEAERAACGVAYEKFSSNFTYEGEPEWYDGHEEGFAAGWLARAQSSSKGDEPMLIDPLE